MATFKGTVNASDVSGSHTDFPAYVELSALGITTLAEAESLRFYIDVSLSNEIPREIVSDGEAHIKFPTLSGGDVVYADYDGVRSDYATDATYGAENVWSDYKKREISPGGSDSTGNGNTASLNGGVSAGGAGDPFGGNDATEFDGSNDYLDYGAAEDFLTNGAPYTLQTWAYVDSANINNSNEFFSLGDNPKLRYDSPDGFAVSVSGAGASHSTASISADTWYKVTVTVDGNGDTAVRVNGANKATGSGANTTVPADGLDGEPFIFGSDDDVPNRPLNGRAFEMRVREDVVVDDDWDLTEYNNQNDPASFWTWEEIVDDGVTSSFLLGGSL